MNLLAKLSAILMSVVTPVAAITRKIAAALALFFAAIFGHMHWQPPTWLTALGRALAFAWRFLVADRRRLAAAALLLVAAVGARAWYKSLPVPLYVTYKVNAPALTSYNDEGISIIYPLTIEFDDSVAPLAHVDKPVTAGITLAPKMAGVWSWQGDKILQFKPKSDWPIDQSFTVAFDRKGFFAPGVELEDYSVDFHTQPFVAKIAQSQFYQDPRDPNLKKLVATVTFTHPVDAGQFEQRVSLLLAKDAAYLGLKPDSRTFSVIYDKFKLSAYIHSAALAMPRDDTPITLRIDKGVHAARGGNETKDRLESSVIIPGRASLRFSGLQMTIVDNAKYEPEQIMLLTSSSPVAEHPLTGKVTAWLLPVRHPKQDKQDRGPYQWTDASQIGKDILAISQPLQLSYVPSEEGSQTTHGFKFKAPVGRYIYAYVPENVEGIGGYISGKPYAATFQVDPYKQTLTFLGKGALLSLSGDKKLGYLVRDVDHVEIEIGRVLPNQLQHIAPTMYDFTNPSVNPRLADSTVERFIETRDYSDKQPGKPTYDSIDLGKYLRGTTAANRGLFLLRIRAIQPPKEKGAAPDTSDATDNPGQDNEGDQSSESENEGAGLEDDRLILITDLGFIVKLAKDGTRDVFVQSIHTGLPVDGVRIEAIGRNGQAALAATTENGGRAKLPKLTDLKREKSPLMILAHKDNDLSFMPFQTQGRGLDLSRFDTGGIVNEKSVEQVTAYLYSDRGIYRPGETAHLGLIARTADWKQPLTGLPVEVEVTDPKGTVVSRNSIKLSPTAFEDAVFTSQPTAPTGTYEATAYLVKKGGAGDSPANPSEAREKAILGSTSFKVQEFEPDRLKVRLDLSDRPLEGWLKPDDVKAHATVAHLFGEPSTGTKVEAEMSLTAVLPHFAKYADYRFQVGEALNEPFHETLTDAVTDDHGVATFTPDLARFTGRAYRLSLLVRAYEAEGGRNVAAQNSAIVSDAPYLIGVKPDGDLAFVKRSSARAAHWLAVNQQLNPVVTAELTLEWVQRKYVSVLTQQGNQTYKYVSKLRETVRDSRKVRIAAGGSNIPLPTQEPGDFLLILRNADGSELNRVSYSVAGDANLSKSLDRDAELQVQLDKPGYAAGETIAVSIRAPYSGAGLITLERDRVYQHVWFKSSTTSSVQHITVPADFEGNGYVNVQFVRDPSSDEIFLSPLSYGVAPFNASLAARTESLAVTAAKEVKPGTPLTIHVVPAEASRIAVLAVDEGILQVARYKNPDPLGFFFQKKMLEVSTTQILDLILPDFAKFLALAAPGGDADGGFSRQLNPFAKKRKPPVAWWSGIVDVGPGGRDFRYDVPDYFNGKLRIVAVAVTPKKIGTAETGTEVRGSFILTPNVPTMVAPGDEFTASVGIYNNSTGAKGPIHIEVQPGAALSMAGPSAIDLDIADKHEASAEFRFKAHAPLGSADIKFIARRGPAEGHIDESVSVRPATPYRTQLTLGKFDSASTTVKLTRDLYDEKRSVVAAQSSVPLVWGQGLAVWLDNYQYSCTEQLVSKGMSGLIVAARPEFGVVKSKEGLTPADVVSVLQSRQNQSAGLGLWSSSPDTADYPTAYATQFLLEAKDRNQKIPPALLESLDQWLQHFGSTPAPSLADGRNRAYAVYLLARQGIKPAGELSNVEQELSHRYAQQWPTDVSAAWLAATYRLMQRNADADKLIANIPWSRQKRDFAGDLYYDPATHDAQLLYITAKYFPARLPSVPSTALEDLAAAVSANRIDSDSAAWILLALDAYAKAVGADFKRIPIAKNTPNVVLTKTGPLAAYYSIDESGFDRNPPAPISQGIEVFHEFLDAKGNTINKVTVGREFLVRLRIRATKRDVVTQIALVDLLPGGTEAVLEVQPPSDSSTPGEDPAQARQRAGAAALPIGVPGQSTWPVQHADLREDRLILYGDAGKDVATFVYRVRATNAGIFQAPPAFAEGMYDRTIIAITAPAKLEVVKP